MPLVRRKRGAPVDDDDEYDSDDAPATQKTQRRRTEADVDDDDYAERNGDARPGADGTLKQMGKKLVRLALACEYSRTPIRRLDISAKVLGTNGRQFKAVFAEAQLTLQTVFGMEMTELPMKEKITIQQRRAAQNSDKAKTSSSSWVLRSTLPDKFKDPAIIQPPKVPTTTFESAYVGLYTFVITIINLAGGSLQEAKLERYLKRTNTDESTPIGRTDQVLSKMVKDGYIVKVKDSSSGEDVIEYVVGPRGKVEVGTEGAAGMVRKVYGNSGGEDLEVRLERSLQIAMSRNKDTTGEKGEKGANKGKSAKATQPEPVAEESSEDGD